MKRFLLILFLIIAIAAVVAGVGYKLHGDSKRDSIKKLELTEATMDRIINQMDNIEDVKKLKRYLMDYLRGVIDAVNSKGFLGFPIYKQKEQHEIYDNFIKRITRFRQALIDLDENNPLTDNAKKSVMKSFGLSCKKYLLSKLGGTEEEAGKHKFYTGWSSGDQEKLYIRDEDLPEEEVAQADTGFSKEISKFNAVDGKLIERKPDPRLKTVVTERILTDVSYDNAKSIIGSRVELHMIDGTIEKGRLLGAEDQFLLLSVRMEGGSVSMRITRGKIAKIVQVVIKEMTPIKNKGNANRFR